MQLATAVWTTDPTMEQGLEAPAPGTDAGNRDGREGEQSASRGTARKGEEARTAVKGKASNGRPRDAAPRRRSVSATARSDSVAVGGGKASKGGKGALRSLVSRRGETGRTPGSAAGRNKPARSERIKPSRWCETTRTARGKDWLSSPEGKRGDADPGKRTPRLGTMEGRSLDNPKRGCPAGEPDCTDRDATEQSASRSGGSRAHAHASCRARS
jgi:hypothetical protein